MSKLVDRAARIIDPQFDSFGHLGADYVRRYQDETRAKVRAVLAAMREPTEAMVRAGYQGAANALGKEEEATWRAMIDAANLE